MSGWSRNNDYIYPDDFENILNEVKIYVCPTSEKRVILSNGIPDHDVRQGNPNSPCEIKWAISMPLNPQMASSKSEIPSRGIVAMAINGVPAYGAQEGGSTNAVEPEADSTITDAQFWYGHAAQNNDWHFHNPHLGQQSPSSESLLAYALDGYPIYGPLEDASGLDACNGRTVNGKYQYHVRELDQVDSSLEYCNGSSPETNWNYILGCYSGTIDETQVVNSDSYNLPADCVEESETPAPIPSTPAPVASTPAPTASTPAPTASTPAPVASTPAPVVTTTAPAPPTSSTCEDTTLRFKVTWNNNLIMRDCIWIGNRATIQRCSLPGVSAACPVTCGTCSTCEDTTLRFKVTWNGNLIMRDCIWIGNRATIQRCNIDGVAEACPATCGICS